MMAKEKTRIPDFDDIVFKNRNKEYGAYKLRKKYHRTAIMALVIGIIVLCAAVITPYFRATTIQAKAQKKEREVIAVMENLEQPEDELTVEPPPPPPPAETQQQLKYVAPEVVDTIKPEDDVQLLTADESVEVIQDEEVIDFLDDFEQQEEIVEEYEPPEEVFVIVEEMPEFPGGTEALFEYINDNIQYPQVALDNKIEGNVIVRFCVTYQGEVDQISVIRGIHPALDSEAVRLVSTLPQWQPGKQAGNPVNVWYTLRIQFQLLEK
jgi:protein TonB